jgi:hypothetical protein
MASSVTKGKVLIVTTFLLGVGLLFVASPWLLSQYVASAPSAADPLSGHVQPFNQHGIVVYLSMSEQLCVHGSAGLGVLLLGASGLLLARHRP